MKYIYYIIRDINNEIILYSRHPFRNSTETIELTLEEWKQKINELRGEKNVNQI